MGLEKDWSLEHKFEPQIKAILADQFITKDIDADMEQATDFAIYVIKPFKVAVRLRRYDYYPSFSHQFTVRWSRPSGAETEIDKIREGKVDYFLYGFIDESETRIIQHFIGDLAIFRNNEPDPCQIFQNDPYDSKFAVWNINQFPTNFIIKFWNETQNSTQTTIG